MSTIQGVTLSKLKLDDETVTKTNNYGYAQSVLTLKTAYLSALDNGEHVFVLEMSEGNSMSITVTVTN